MQIPHLYFFYMKNCGEKRKKKAVLECGISKKKKKKRCELNIYIIYILVISTNIYCVMGIQRPGVQEHKCDMMTRKR